MLEQQHWETNALHRKPVWSEYRLHWLDCGRASRNYYISAAPLFLWCYTRCYSSVTLTENELQNRYLLCHSGRETEKFSWPVLHMSPWQWGSALSVKPSGTNCPRRNYRLELPLQLTEKSFLLHSRVETMKYVRLSLKLFVTYNYRTPLQKLLYTTYLTLTSCPCHLHLNPNCFTVSKHIRVQRLMLMNTQVMHLYTEVNHSYSLKAIDNGHIDSKDRINNFQRLILCKNKAKLQLSPSLQQRRKPWIHLVLKNIDFQGQSCKRQSWNRHIAFDISHCYIALLEFILQAAQSSCQNFQFPVHLCNQENVANMQTVNKFAGCKKADHNYTLPDHRSSTPRQISGKIDLSGKCKWKCCWWSVHTRLFEWL